MAYIVSADQQSAIDFAPASTVTEVLQNIRTILSTLKGTIPLDREFGLDPDIIDLPTPQAEARLSQEIFDAIKRYEPRANIEKITFNGSIDGKLIPTVEVTINETS